MYFLAQIWFPVLYPKTIFIFILAIFFLEQRPKEIPFPMGNRKRKKENFRLESLSAKPSSTKAP